MAKATKNDVSYQALSAELSDILVELQREDLDVDTAVGHYERGLALIKELEQYLQTAENKVSRLQAKFDSGS